MSKKISTIILFSVLILFSKTVNASQDFIVPIKGMIRTAEKVVLGRIVKRIPILEINDGQEKKICGWTLQVDVVQSFKGGDESFEVFTNDAETYAGKNLDYFIIAFNNPSYGTGNPSAVGNCAEQPGLKEFLVQDPNGEPGKMVTIVMVGPHEKKYSELDISNLKYSSIMGKYGHEQYIFALDPYAKEKYGGDWLIQPKIYRLYDTVNTKTIEAGENENYPNFYTALNFFDVLKETLYSKNDDQIACENVINELLWVETADPQYDAATAIQNKDEKLKAVLGFTVNIPGVNDDTHNKAYKTGNYNIIKGTSDGICSDRHFELNSKAREYAKKYNKIIQLKKKLN